MWMVRLINFAITWLSRSPKNTYIHNLPLEILTEIFLFCVPNDITHNPIRQFHQCSSAKYAQLGGGQFSTHRPSGCTSIMLLRFPGNFTRTSSWTASDQLTSDLVDRKFTGHSSRISFRVRFHQQEFQQPRAEGNMGENASRPCSSFLQHHIQCARSLSQPI